ncbi:hypothetical protein [Streptomyces sp. R35]|uniref:Poly(3-hydroxyalkanoate) polymerase subunit PhaE n=1 Tax=Streptomyces sp. R35 TaxID=3238630 RepID=A0AB39SG24_9ACTN
MPADSSGRRNDVPHWWDDWLKFTPGCPAFAWAFGNGIWLGIRKWHDRTAKLALGAAADELREHLTEVAQAWDQAFAYAPGAVGPMVRWSDHVFTPQEREESARVQTQFGKEADVARSGLQHIKVALVRLDELERKTHGR